MNIRKYTVWTPDERDVEARVEVRWHGGSTFNVYVDGTEVDVFTLYGRDGQPPSLGEADVAAREHLDDMLAEIFTDAS